MSLSICSDAVRLSERRAFPMKYMLLIHDNEKAWGTLGDEEQKQIMAEYRRITEQMRASGHHCAGSQLKCISASGR